MRRILRAPMKALLLSLISLSLSLSTGCVAFDDGLDHRSDTAAPTAVPNAVVAAAPQAQVVEGVPFSAAEAAAVLAFVNQATLEQLDLEVGIDVRAAESIIAAQPIASVGELASLYFVGPVTLELLKAVALQSEAQRTLAAAAVRVRDGDRAAAI